MNRKFVLAEGWKFKINEKSFPSEEVSIKKNKLNKWLDAEVPGTVLTDLLNLKLIPDPFYADNELKLQWIGESDWIYKISFDYPKDFKKDESVYLVFEGLDTAAKIVLNEKELGTTNNMFLKYEFEVSDKIKNKKNKLEIFFTSPLKYARSLEYKYGKLPVALNSERVFIRKAQYSFGWDWGPSFPSTGIWKNIFLEQKENNFIEDFSFKTISVEEKNAEVEIRGSVNSNNVNQNISLKLWNENSLFNFSIPTKSKKFYHRFNISNPKLWWPNGMGEPNLYNFQITLNDKENILDEIVKKVGIRKIELQLIENNEKTFRFIVNNKKIFVKGANWIPADSFLPRVNKDKYKKLLTYAKEANMNMIRVWGGGIYENDIFYELCDELGLMVWQDFMFACAAYPEFEDFIKNIKEEFRQNINRLKNHPCISIWCGNNENEWLWFQSQNSSFKEMPGYKIYKEILPSTLKELNVDIPYWQSSPFSDEKDPNSLLSGNRHQWELWSRWVDYDKVAGDESLFVTEFGFQGPANRQTLEKAIPEEERKPQSYLFEFHNKQVEGNERLFKMLVSHLPVKTDWEDFIFLSQLNQGFALKTCIEHWRLNSPKTNGTIIWQLNDCWPVTSWALIDSELKKKLAYYFVKDSFSNQITLLKKNDKSLEIYLINDNNKDSEVILKIHFISLLNKKNEIIFLKEIKISSSEKQLVSSIFIPEEVLSGEGLIITSLYKFKDQLIHRNYYKEKEWKHLKLPKAKIKIKNYAAKKFVKVSSDKPAFFVKLESENFKFEKNGLVILPDEAIEIPYEIILDKGNKNKFNVQMLNTYL